MKLKTDVMLFSESDKEWKGIRCCFYDEVSCCLLISFLIVKTACECRTVCIRLWVVLILDTTFASIFLNIEFLFSIEMYCIFSLAKTGFLCVTALA